MITKKSLLLKIFRPHWSRLSGGVVLTLIVSSLAVPLAWIVRQAFDIWIPEADTDSLIWGGVGLLGIRVLHASLTVVTRIINVKATEKMTLDLRSLLIDRLFGSSRKEVDSYKWGELYDLVLTESERISRLFNNLAGAVFPAAINVLALTAVLTYLSWKLLLILLFVWPLVWLLNESVRRQTIKRTKVTNARWRIMSGAIQEKIRVLNLIRFEHREKKESDDAKEQARHYSEAAGPVAIMNTGYLEFQGVVLTFISVAVLTAGGREVSNNWMTLGDFISFYMVVSLLNQSLREMAAGLYHVFVGWESIRQVVDWLNNPDPEVYDGSNSIELKDSLTLSQVDFEYRSEQGLLSGIDLQLQRGKTVVLLGPNGSGKSTILWLLLGFYKPTKGTLLADDQPYEELDMGQLRAQIGMASQNALLLDASIRDNVRYSQPGASDDEIIRALKLSGSEKLLNDLPEGLDSLVGPNGTLLSGGQRQRISLARALVKDPAFLFLDEPTNHLDEKSVTNFLGNLDSLDSRPGILIITHDNALRAVADLVYEIHEGGLRRVTQEENRADTLKS